MRIGSLVVVAYAATCIQAVVVSAQTQPLTLAEALARAREQAPQITSARLAIEETRARLVGASLRLQSNPELELGAANRSGPGDRFTDFEVGVGQGFEPGSRRFARVAGATAAIAERTANLDEVTRVALRATAAAYFRGLHAQSRIQLLEASQELANGVYAAADRRFKAGDIAVLDVNIARASLARVRAEREAAEATRVLAIGELKELLQLEGDVRVEGELRRRDEPNLDALLEAVAQRPELRSLAAGVQEAEAEADLGRALGKPDYRLATSYSRDEGDHVVFGGVTITLPTFSKGQELRVLGAARAARLRAALESAQRRVRIEVGAAFDAHSRRIAAIRVLEADAIPELTENERLTMRSFEVGQLGLAELLLIRREILDTRSQYLDALLEAALGRIDLDASAGVLR